MPADTLTQLRGGGWGKGHSPAQGAHIVHPWGFNPGAVPPTLYWGPKGEGEEGPPGSRRYSDRPQGGKERGREGLSHPHGIIDNTPQIRAVPAGAHAVKLSRRSSAHENSTGLTAENEKEEEEEEDEEEEAEGEGRATSGTSLKSRINWYTRK